MALAVAFSGDQGDPRVVGEAVQGGGGEEMIAEDLRPLLRGAVGGEHDAAALVAVGDHFIEVFGSLRVQGSETEVIQNEQVRAR